MNIKNYMKILRPKQWMKNFFVMLPLFFGGELFNGKALLAGAITFLAYSFAASSIYCFNDIHDVDDDRRHPVKRLRPVASGAVSVSVAYVLMFICFALSMLSMFFLPDYALQTGGILLLYWLLNLAYCARLKQYAIIDVCIVAFGFVLMTFLITLFMSFAKRRDDVIRMERTGEAPRKNTIRYNLTFINQAITITASVTLVCYIMYTVSPEVIQNFQTDYLYLTTIFVLVGLLRYIQLTVVDQKSGDPTKVLLKDRFTQLVVVAWLLTFLLIIYVLKG